MRRFNKIVTAVTAAALAFTFAAACAPQGDASSSSSGTSSELVYYTVSFDADGGTLAGENTMKAEKGKSIVLPEVAKEGSSFVGWYDGDALAGKGGASYTPSGNVTLKARWSVEENYAETNMERAVEYAKLIKEKYWNSQSKKSFLTPDGGTPYLWPYTEQVSMVNGILRAMEENDADRAFFSAYLTELIEGLRYYRVSSVRVGAGQAWENPEHYLAAFGETDGTANAYAIYNSGLNGNAIDSVNAGMDGVFFDDNIWVAKEFYYAYLNLGEVKYLNEAINVVNWIVGEGYEETKGLNGIYWNWAAKFRFDYKSNGGLDDSSHASLNACSSAPTAMMLVKLYNAMGDAALGGKFDAIRGDYQSKASKIYEFCYSELRNPASGCLRDKVFLKEGFETMTNLEGRIELVDAQELPYNTGTFMTAGAELYNYAVAANKTAVANVYLKRNEEVARAADKQFANTMVKPGEYSYNSNSWFTSFLLEGFIDLNASVPACGEYIEHMRSALDYAWKNNRAEDKLVCPAWIEGWTAFSDTSIGEGNPRQILLQSANAHCYAMLAYYYA